MSDDTWDLAQATPTPGAASSGGAPPATSPTDLLGQQIQQLLAAPPTVHPDTTPASGGWRGFLGHLGEALGGGIQSGAGAAMSPRDRQLAGLRALGDFSTGLMAASHYQPGQTIFSNLAGGFEGAQRGLLGSEQMAAGTLAAQQNYQLEQQKMQMERLKTALPLLQMQQGAGLPNVLLGGGGGQTGTAGGGASPIPAGNYGAGGPNDTPVPAAYMPFYQEASQRTGIPVDVLIAQSRQESGFDPKATGKAGEIGIGQIMPSTAAKPGFGMAPVDPAALRDPRTNINFQADYLKAHMGGGDPNDPTVQRKALAGYNGGGDPNYVANVTRYQPKLGGGVAKPTLFAGPGAPPGGAVAPSGSGGPTPAPPPPGAPAAAPVGTPTPVGNLGLVRNPDGSVGTPPTPAATPTPAGKLTFEQWQAQHPMAPTDADRATWTITPPDLAAAQAAKQQAAIELSRAQQQNDTRGIGNAQTAFEAADKRVTDAQAAATAKTAELQQNWQKNALDTQRQLFQAEQQRQQEAELKQQELAQTAAEADKQRAAALEVEKVKAGYTAAQAQQATEQKVGSTQLESMQAAAQKAEAIQPMLRELVPLLKSAPSGAIGQLLQSHQDWLPTLTAMGLDPKTATVTQLVNGLTDYLSLDLKPAATGALRVGEIPMLKGLLPQLGQAGPAQQQALARILNYTQRVKAEADFANENFGANDPKTNQPNYKILYKNIDAPMQLDENGQRVGGGLGPVVPEAPAPVANPNPGQIEAARRYQKYVANLPSGMPYNTYERQNDGSLQRVLKIHE